MDRKSLKMRGKALFGGNNLFKGQYWQSVLVTLFMFFNIGSFVGPKFEIEFDDLESVFSSVNDINFVKDFFINAFATTTTLAIAAVTIFSFILTIFIVCTFKAGGIRYFLKLRKNNPTDVKEVFQNFKDKTFINIAKLSFCKYGFTYLWSLLFFIPGIIKSYEYWAIDYIVATRPNIDRQEAFRLSKTLMSGHKWDLFVLQLSFIGWQFLDSFTSGLLGIFYVNPYMQATFVEFFSDIRLEALAKGLITPFDVPDYEYFTPVNQDTPFSQGYTQQYATPENPQQTSQYYGGFAQPNPQQYNQQPFAQPVNSQPPVTPQAPLEMPQAPVATPQEEAESTTDTVEE